MAINSIPLSDFFKLVKKPRFVLGTTYTLSLAFFESVIFQKPLIDRSHLRSCLIICDPLGYRRALDEAKALQHAGQNYMAVPAPVADCFHSKVWLLIGEDEFALLVGSGNLTQSGFMLNAELFDSLHFTLEDPPDETLLQDVLSFLSGLAGMWRDKAGKPRLCIHTLEQMKDAIRTFQTIPPTLDSPRLLHSFRGRLIDQLPQVSSCMDLYIAAPFFGDSLEGLKMLTKKFRSQRLHVFPAIHEEATDLPIATVRSDIRPTTLKRLELPPSATGFAHLKLYGIAEDEQDAWLYCTSANCTLAAWDGLNIEAGLLRRVGTPELLDYFKPQDVDPPLGKLQKFDSPVSEQSILHFSAVDTGTAIEITALDFPHRSFPLAEVVVTVRAGSDFASTARDGLFDGLSMARISWSSLQSLRREAQLALSLTITGKDQRGDEVTGACFVENRMLLTADPTHRSAWRGAYSLLHAEADPDLPGIGALFSMAVSLFEGELIPRSPSRRFLEEESIKGDTDRVEAVWPPLPAKRSTPHAPGANGSGELHLCQRILESFFRPAQGPDSTPAHRPGLENTDDATIAESEEDVADPTVEDRIEAAKKRAWDKAFKEYTKLLNRLKGFIPDQNTAPTLWVAAIFVFLASLSARYAPRSDKELPKTTAKIPASGLFVDDFVRTMVNPRKQSANFCCSAEMRYRSEIFPPLSQDLKDTFNVVPDSCLAVIMLVLIADMKCRETVLSSATELWRRYRREVIPPDFQPGEDARAAGLKVWRKYISDETDSKKASSSEKAFLAAFDSLLAPDLAPA